MRRRLFTPAHDNVPLRDPVIPKGTPIHRVNPPQNSRRTLALVIAAILAAMVLLVGATLAVINTVESNRNVTNSTNRALCALRADVQNRVDTGNAFLRTHPQGLAGIPAATLQASLNNSEHTVKALRSLTCPGQP